MYRQSLLQALVSILLIYLYLCKQRFIILIFDSEIDDSIRSCDVENVIDLNKCLLQVIDEDVKPFVAIKVNFIFVTNQIFILLKLIKCFNHLGIPELNIQVLDPGNLKDVQLLLGDFS